MCRAVVAIVLAHAAFARAESSVTVTLNAQGEALAADLGLSVPELIQQNEAKIDELYKLSRLDQLLRAFANTAAFAQRGLGVDYDPDAGDIMIGIAAAGIHGDVAIGTTNELLGGSIINFGVMGGVNLERWRHARWTVFANGFYESTTIHGLEGHLLTLGAHVQYRILPATQPGHVRWSGLSATTGLEYARWSIGTASSIESHFTAQGPAERSTVGMSSTGTLDVLSTTVDVPLELTTAVRFFDTLVLYGGGGLGVTAGDSTIVAQLDSLLTINADDLPVGNAVITGSGTSSPSPVAVHGLAGLQIHTNRARVFLQGAFAPGEISASLGLRIVPN